MIRIRYSIPKSIDKKSGLKSNRGKLFTALFGFLGGMGSTVAHAGGLMMSVYMLQKKTNPRVFVGTLVLFSP